MLDGIVKRFPKLQVTALLRSKSDDFTSFFPKVKVVLGDFDSFDVIQNAAQEADIVIRMKRRNLSEELSVINKP